MPPPQQYTIQHYLKRFANTHPLSYRVTRYVLICSFIFIVISTSVQLGLNYRKELRVIDQQNELISSSYTGSLAKSLWDLDTSQIQLQLKGIQNLPDVMFLDLTSSDIHDGSQIVLNPPPDADHLTRNYRFDLIYDNGLENPRLLGHLNVVYDLQAIQYRILRNGIDTLLIQTLLVVIIALVLLLIFHRLITRHLEEMADYSRQIALGVLDHPLELKRYTPTKPDELDALAGALNEMRTAISQDIRRRDREELALRENRDQLQVLIERRTESLRLAKEAAEEANNAKSQFLSTMSHEIRTPMNGMLGMVQMLKKSPLNAQQLEQVEVLYEACDCLLETFNHVLQYGQLIEGAYTAESSNFSLQRTLHSLRQLMLSSTEGKNLDLVLEMDPALSDLYYGKVNPLRQILTNLLSNAIKFTERGRVRLAAQLMSEAPEQQWIRLEVEDTGIGIAPHLLEHIFDRFSQADESITRRFGGAGLGLAICQELARVLEGRIGVDSTPGQGSLFWLELPLSPAQEDLPSSPVLQVTAQNILLVEDVELNRRVATSLLRSHGHRVDIAEDGNSALAKLNSRRYDLVLMDMHLPYISGLDITKRVIADPESPNRNTPIIALTAGVRPESVIRYKEAGVREVVSKPIREEQLLQTIEVICSGKEIPLPTQPVSPLYPDEERVPLPLLDETVLNPHYRALGEQTVRSLMRSFLELQTQIRPELELSISLGLTQDTGKYAHKLAGACDTLGLVRASHKLRALERRSESNIVDCEPLISELIEILDATVERVEAELKPS